MPLPFGPWICTTSPAATCTARSSNNRRSPRRQDRLTVSRREGLALSCSVGGTGRSWVRLKPAGADYTHRAPAAGRGMPPPDCPILHRRDRKIGDERGGDQSGAVPSSTDRTRSNAPSTILRVATSSATVTSTAGFPEPNHGGPPRCSYHRRAADGHTVPVHPSCRPSARSPWAGQLSRRPARRHRPRPDRHRAARDGRGDRPERGYVGLAGLLDGYETVTGYLVTPVVGFVRPGFTLTPDPFEVADVFEVPLAFLLNESSRRIGSHVHDGRRRRYYAFEYAGHRIWGATAECW